ncbi:MAG TPA: [protein-PII] uridylyltransferase [Terriglobales bacterium]|jgi:[protein-PII] uridylyltransferase|nr:[protein-PII] uridylyltransferase [Terriglobales bacterium]
MNSTPLLDAVAVLQEFYSTESAAVRQAFEDSHNGQAAIRARSDLLDTIIRQIWGSTLGESPGLEGVCVAALGGYGRRALFPCSDVDLLFLCEGTPSKHAQRGIRRLSQTLWDLHLRVSPTTRSLADCSRLHHDNVEFNISLLDCRYVSGDAELFEQLHGKALPGMVAREARELLQRLTDLTRARHNKYGNTIFHLEPNLKDSPGGMRDYHLAGWLTTIARLEQNGTWPALDSLFPDTLHASSRAAVDFLSAVRCFLHYHQGRDLNALTYDLQSEAAGRGIGISAAPVSPAEWMRAYFRHVRSIHRLTGLLDEISAKRSGLYRIIQNRKSRLSNADFSVVQGRVFLRQSSSVADPEMLLSLFEFVARHGVKLSADAERYVEVVLPVIQRDLPARPDLWAHLRRILVLPHAGAALRAMHRLGLLVVLFKEFQAIDSLVIRDYYHRYTVDEHSFVTIERLHALSVPDSDLHRRFQDILLGIERPELLFLALLFHDVGKGMPGASHVEGSLEALQGVCGRLRLEPDDCELVRFLIASHLRMSATTQQRDIFDPETVHHFAESVGTVERLKMLTLLTYADVSAVNPQALTPWKAEMLWRLFAAAENYLNRSVDDERLPAGGADNALERILRDAPRGLDEEDFRLFLEGFPRRYLLTHSGSVVLTHYEMWRALSEDDVQVRVESGDPYYELTLMTRDRPRLFATLAGVLSAWRMDILKAEAFSNRAGVVLDTIRFSDRFHTLALNPSEMRRLQRNIEDVVAGELDVRKLVDEKTGGAPLRSQLAVKPDVRFHNDCSSHSTLLEIIAKDRPGLLYDISTAVAELGCNIEVALIDTQGQTALDVFYLSCEGEKLGPELQGELQDAILDRL